jgi:ribosomal protein L14E/L6E/L27E
MDSTINLTVGQLVKSRAGRDNGVYFIVLDIVDKTHVHVVDGDVRKLDNPKLKKIKHLIVYNTVIPEFKYKLESIEKINDAYVRKILDSFKSESKSV